MKYTFTYIEAKKLFTSEFGKLLTKEQFKFIRKVNESEYNTYDDYWIALETLLGWDLEIICREN